MFILRYCHLLVLLTFFLLCELVSATPLKVIAYNPPYNYPEGDQRLGIFGELFQLLEEKTAYQFEFVHFPIARAMQEFDKGNLDIDPGVSPNWRTHVRESGLFTIAFYRSETVVVFRPGTRVPVYHATDLSGKSVGIVRGYSYPRFDVAFSTDTIHRVDALSEDHLIQQLYKGRYDQIFIAIDTMLYYQRTHPEYRIFEIGNIIAEEDIMFRVHPKHARLLTQFNQVIKALKKEGAIDAIYNKYQ